MKRFFLLLSLTSLLFGSFGCSPEPAAIAGKAMQNLLTELHAAGLSVAVIKDNQIVYTGAFGSKNMEDASKITPEDLFRIASISKSFTATAVMQLYEAGKFALDDDVSPALGFSLRNPKFPDRPITYRMLLSHTSSMRDAGGYFTLDVINPAVTPDPSASFHDYAPGQEYDYCNLGFNTLGALVEIHSGERFDNYILHHILQPLGLYGGFNVDSLDASRFVALYDRQEGQWIHEPEAYRSRAEGIAHYKPGYDTPLFSPTGGMKITAAGLAIHLLVQLNAGSYGGTKILSPESVSLMQTRVSRGEEPEGSAPECGYGFALRKTDRLIPGEMLIGHTGGAYGLASAMFGSPGKKFGFVMMTNGYDSSIPREPNGFLAIQSRVINTLYRIFILNDTRP